VPAVVVSGTCGAAPSVTVTARGRLTSSVIPPSGMTASGAIDTCAAARVMPRSASASCTNRSVVHT
jgi:hypothetical protein